MRSNFRAAILLFAVLSASASAAELPKEQQLELAQQVHDIFEAKCVDCHGPELPRPKGKFGYVLDLKKVAANPDYLVPGDAEKSEIYQMVLTNEMPGEDANVPPLTEPEIEIVKRWIEAGAPGELKTPAPAEPEANTAVLVPSVRPVEPLWKMGLRWIGKFHPVSTHFPVALMFAAVLAEAFGWFTRRDAWLQTVRFLVVIAALGGLSATCLGWINAYFSSYDKAPGALLWWHRWLGSATAIWAVICAAAAFMGECREGSFERNRFRVALLVGAFLVGISGFLGSALIYGLDHYKWP
jgi:uncharacterized membrane protein/mono/diheme cytochrome c family protein